MFAVLLNHQDLIQNLDIPAALVHKRHLVLAPVTAEAEVHGGGGASRVWLQEELGPEELVVDILVGDAGLVGVAVVPGGDGG